MDCQTLLYEDTYKLPEIFHPADIQKMISTLDHSQDYLKNIWGEFMRARDKALLMTIYLCGLRPNEACSLMFEDFDLERGVIKIRGENNKERKGREIPIPQELVKYLQEYFKFRIEHFWKGSKFMFPSFANQHISAGRWKHIMREKILKPAGLWIEPDCPQHSKTRSYTLRHTRATELLNKTNDIYLVANFLGHAKLNSTRVYLHKNEKYMDYMRKVVNSLNNSKVEI